MNLHKLLLSLLCLSSAIQASAPKLIKFGLATAIGVSTYYSHKTYQELQTQQIKNEETKKSLDLLQKDIADLTETTISLANSFYNEKKIQAQNQQTYDFECDPVDWDDYDFDCDDEDDNNDFACGEKISIFNDAANSVKKDGDTTCF